MRSHCFIPALPPFEQNSAAERAHAVFHKSPLPCYYFILGHQKIEAVFQLFLNISSFMRRTPAQRHTQSAQLCCPCAFFHPQETFNMTLSPPGTTLCLCGREDEVGKDRVIYCSPLLRVCFLYPHQHYPCCLDHCSHGSILAAT